jgi:hypothetical protein
MKAQWWQVHAGYFTQDEPANDNGVFAEFAAEEVDPCAEVVRITRELWKRYGDDRRQQQEDALELYNGCDWSGDEPGKAALRRWGAEPDSAGYNLIQSITDTAVSRLVQNKIRPLILPENGNAQQAQQAQALQKVVEGTFWDCRLYKDLGPQICFDGHLFNFGAIKVYPDYAGKRPVLDRIDPCRFMVSPREAELGQPRSGYYYDSIDRSELLAMFRHAKPEVIEAIKNAKAAPDDLRHGDREDFVDDIEVFEAWHLPSSSVDRSDPRSWGVNEDGDFDPTLNPGHDGFRVLCIEGQTLIAEPWPFPYFPIAFFMPQPKLRSFGSRSVPETLCGAQDMVNRLNKRIDDILYFHARPLLVVWKAAGINPTKITNGLTSILESKVQPSQAIHHVVAQSVPSEIISRIDAVIAWAERQFGLNDMAMTGAKPAGIEHAPALEHLSDELSARHAVRGRAWGYFHQDLATLAIDCHRMIADHCKRNGETYKVMAGGDRDLQEIDWNEADLTAFVYRVKVWDTNLLPLTPAAKANTLMSWMQAGLITAEQALTQIDHPDIEALIGDHVSKRRNIEVKLAKLLSGASFEDCMPHPYMDLELCLTIASSKLNDYESKGYGYESLERLRQFYQAAQQEIDKKKAKEAPPPPPQGPPGPEGPPPPPGNDNAAPPEEVPAAG